MQSKLPLLWMLPTGETFYENSQKSIIQNLCFLLSSTLCVRPAPPLVLHALLFTCMYVHTYTHIQAYFRSYFRLLLKEYYGSALEIISMCLQLKFLKRACVGERVYGVCC